MELQFQATSVNGQRMVRVSPVFFETAGNAIPFSNQRINTMAGRLPDQVAVARQRLVAVSGQIQSLQAAGTVLTNYPPKTASEDVEKRIRLQEMQNDLKRLIVQEKSLMRAFGPLEHRLSYLPALVEIQRRVHGALAIGFTIRAVDKEGNKTVLLEAN